MRGGPGKCCQYISNTKSSDEPPMSPPETKVMSGDEGAMRIYQGFRDEPPMSSVENTYM